MGKLKACLILSVCVNLVLLLLLLSSVALPRPATPSTGTYVQVPTDWATIENVVKAIPFEIRAAGQVHSLGVSITLANSVILTAKEPRIDDIFDLVKTCPNKKITCVTE